jgi:cytoskeletal protein RodZ
MSLEALERSDLSRLPGGIFTRAFIRAYAEEVGLDPDRTIQDFIAELPADSGPAAAHPGVIEDGEKLESDRRAVATAARLALVSLPIIGLIIYYGTHRAPAAPASGNTRAAAPDMPASAPPMTVSSAAEPLPAQMSDLSIEIAPRAACWVSVTVDGQQMFSGLMNAGEKRVITAKEHVVLTVGDAGAFAYSINGRAGKSLGAPREAVTRRISLSNLQDFLTP